MSEQHGISMTVTAASVNGQPKVDVLEGGRELRIWPSARGGEGRALVTISVADWRSLVNLVDSEILAAGVGR